MKKVLTILAVVVIVGAAGMAVAERRHEWRQEGAPGYCPMERGEMHGEKRERMRREEGERGRFRMRKQGMERMWKNMPDEIRSKVTELQKLKIDMRDALSRNPVDRAKAVALHEKMTVLRQEIGTWHFNKRLDMIEQRQKEMELNEKVPVGAPSPLSSDKMPEPRP